MISKRIENRILEFAGNLRFKRGSLTIICRILIMPQRNCKVDESKILMIKLACRVVARTSPIVSALLDKKTAAEF